MSKIDRHSVAITRQLLRLVSGTKPGNENWQSMIAGCFVCVLLTVFCCLCSAPAYAKPAYQGRVVNYLSTRAFLPNWNEARFKQDLYLTKKLLNVQAIRLFIDPSDFPMGQSGHSFRQLAQVLRLCRQFQLKVELSLFEDWNAYQDIAASRRWIQHFMGFVRQQPGIVGLNLKSELDFRHPAIRPWIQALYQELLRNGPTYYYTVAARSPAEVHQLETWMRPKPDVYLYHLQDSVVQWNHELLALRRLIPTLPQRLQIFRWDTAVAVTDYDQAWRQRLAFYITKKHHLLPAAVNVLARPGAMGSGILRSDRSLTPSFLAAQIYYQLGQLDLDERRLTETFHLFAAKPLAASHDPVSGTARDILTDFLNVYYAVTPTATIRDFLVDSHQRQIQSLLAAALEGIVSDTSVARLAHFEILNEVHTSSHVTFAVRFSFASSLGEFQAQQSFDLRQTPQGFKVAAIHLPTPVFDWRYIKVNPQAMPPVLQAMKPGLQVITRSGQSSEEQQAVWLQWRNNTTQPLDIKPIEVIEADSGKVFVPPLHFFDYAKQLQPGQQIATVVQYPTKPGKRYHVRTDHIPTQPSYQAESHHFAPLQVKVLKREKTKLILDVFNNRFERALWPSLYLQLETPTHKGMATAVLPRLLLPMEHQYIQVDLPQPLQNAQRLVAKGLFYPLLEPTRNLDEAYRYNVMDRFQQALNKYRFILAHFGSQLSAAERTQAYQEMVFLYLKLHDPSASEAVLTQLTSQDPTPSLFYRNAYHSLYDRWMQQHQIERAFNTIQKSLNMFPQDAEFHKLAGYLYNHKKQYPQAIAALLRSFQLSKHKPDPEALSLLYHLYQKDKQFAKAVYYLKILIRLKPQVANYYQALGYLYQRLGHLADAIRAYEHYLTRSHHIAFYPEVAELYLKLGNKRMALALLQSYAYRCHPCNPHYYLKLAHMYKLQPNHRQALRYYAMYARLSGDPGGWQMLGNLYLQAKNHERALVAFQQQVALCPSCYQAYKSLGYVANLLGKSTLSAHYYARFLSAVPADTAIQRELGYAYYQSGDYRQAIKQFESVKAKGTPWATFELDMALAYAYRQNRQFNEALLLYQGLLRKQPANRLIQKNMLLTYLDTQQATAGLQLVQAGQLQLGQDPDMHYTVGILYQSQQDFGHALSSFRQAIQYSVRPKLAYFQLAAASAEQLGDIDGAIGYLRQAEPAFTPLVPLSPQEQAELDLNLGHLYLRKPDIPTALAYLHRAERQEMHHMHLNLELGLAYQMAQKPTQALAYYRRSEAQVRASGLPDLMARLAHAYRQLGRLTQADRLYHQALQVSPNSPELALAFGLLKYQQRNKAEASKWYQTAYRWYQHHGQTPPEELAFALKAVKSPLALVLFQQYVKQMPNHYRYLIEVALLEKPSSKQLRQLSKIEILIPPTDTLYQRLLAALYQRNQAYSEALRLYACFPTKEADDWLNLAALARLNKQNQRARIYYAQGAKYIQKKASDEQRQTLAYGLSELGEYQESLNWLTQIKRMAPADQVVRAQNHAALYQTAEAHHAYLVAFKQLMQQPQSKKNQALYLAIAFGLLQLEQLPDAERVNLHLVAQAPQYYQAQLNLASIYAQQRDFKKARHVLTQVAPLLPHKIKAYQQVATVYRQIKAPREALQWLQRAIQLGRSSPLLALMLGDTYWDLKQEQWARLAYLQAFRRVKKLSFEQQTFLASGLIQVKAYEQAQTLLLSLLKQHPQRFQVLIRLSALYRQWPGFTAKALYYSQWADQALPVQDRRAQQDLAYEYLLLTRYPQALKHLQQAQKINQQAFQPPLLMGDIYQVLGQYALATKAYQESIAKQPYNPEAWFNLGLVQKRLEWRREALVSLQKAAQQDHTFNQSVQQLIQELYANDWSWGDHYQARVRLETQSDQRFLNGEYVSYASLGALHESKWDIRDMGIVGHHWKFKFLTGYQKLTSPLFDVQRWGIGVGGRTPNLLGTDSGLALYVSPQAEYRLAHNPSQNIQYAHLELNAQFQPSPTLAFAGRWASNLGDKDLFLGSFQNHGVSLKATKEIGGAAVAYGTGFSHLDILDGTKQLRQIYRYSQAGEFSYSNERIRYDGQAELSRVFGELDDWIISTEQRFKFKFDHRLAVVAEIGAAKYFLPIQRSQSFVSPALGLEYRLPLPLQYPLYLEAKGRYNYFFDSGQSSPLLYTFTLRSHL